MILALDAGNTRLKWGVREGPSWLVQGALPLAHIDTLPAQLPVWPKQAVIANVAGEDVAATLRALLERQGVSIHWATSQPQQCGVTNDYDNPAQLGADRWAALIGARHLHAGPSLVLMAGTATTVDVLDADGVFRGGLILPGMELMRASLASNTAQLGMEPGRFQTLPSNTADAIFSGCLQAQLGAVERMYAQLGGDPAALCLVSGGGAPMLLDQLRVPCRAVDNLVLEGLVRIGLTVESVRE